LGLFGDQGTAAKSPSFQRLPRAHSMRTNLPLLVSFCLFVVVAAPLALRAMASGN